MLSVVRCYCDNSRTWLRIRFKLTEILKNHQNLARFEFEQNRSSRFGEMTIFAENYIFLLYLVRDWKLHFIIFGKIEAVEETNNFAGHVNLFSTLLDSQKRWGKLFFSRFFHYVYRWFFNFYCIHNYCWNAEKWPLSKYHENWCQ